MDPTNRPPGIGVLLFFVALAAGGQIFYSLTSPGYLPVGLVLFLFFVYLMFGLFRGWNHARISMIAFLVLFCFVAVSNIVAIFVDTEFAARFSEDRRLGYIVKNVIRLLVLPGVIFYLLRRPIRQFFDSSDQVPPPPSVTNSEADGQ